MHMPHGAVYPKSNSTIFISHERVSLRMRCRVKQIKANIRHFIFFPFFPKQQLVKMWNNFSRKEHLRVNHGKPRRKSNPSSPKSGVQRATLLYCGFFSFLRLELCETCSFGAPLLVFVLRPGYGEMPLYCSKVCARPLQHSIILGSCDSTKVILALFCTVVSSRSCENCNGVRIDHVWLVMTYLCLFLCCVQFNVYLSRVPQECKLISWTEWEKEEHESFVLVL